MHDYVEVVQNDSKQFRKELLYMDEFIYNKKRIKLFASLEENVDYIERSFNETEDLEIEELIFQNKASALLYLHTAADIEKCEEIFFKYANENGKEDTNYDEVSGVTIFKSNNLEEIITSIVNGMCVLFVKDERQAYLFDTPIESNRSPEEPDTEKTVRGSHVGFVEDLNTNLHLLRNRIKNEHLYVKYIQLGKETKQNIAIVYMKHLANDEIVAEIEKRLEDIRIDSVFAPGYIEEFIEEKPYSPFPQNLYTERPDRVEAHLMEGRIAIISENSADAIVLPVTFFSFFQSPDDYNSRTYTSTIFRLLRLFSFIGTLLLPPLYIAIVGFHFEIIPYEMITLVKSSITGIPFLPFYEAMFMAVTVELIREAGIRLPSPIGETIGIVGGLIIGDAVVNAGIVSNVMVIVIALTAIMSFSISSYEMGNTVRVLNFPVMIAASLFGFVGIVVAFLFIIAHLCKIESFGVPYLAPLAPLSVSELKDTIIRLPVWKLNRRPKHVRAQDDVRESNSRTWLND